VNLHEFAKAQYERRVGDFLAALPAARDCAITLTKPTGGVRLGPLWSKTLDFLNPPLLRFGCAAC